MLRQMDWDQFQGWIAYYELEPFGEQRADIRSSLVGTAICNVLGRVNGMKRDLFKPMGLVPKFDERSGASSGSSSVASPARGERKPITTAEQWDRLSGILTTNFRPAEDGTGTPRRATRPARKGLNISDRRRRKLESEGVILPS